jgi:DNA-binding MarR family transcriptional regulator
MTPERALAIQRMAGQQALRLMLGQAEHAHGAGCGPQATTPPTTGTTLPVQRAPSPYGGDELFDYDGYYSQSSTAGYSTSYGTAPAATTGTSYNAAAETGYSTAPYSTMNAARGNLNISGVREVTCAYEKCGRKFKAPQSSFNARFCSKSHAYKFHDAQPTLTPNLLQILELMLREGDKTVAQVTKDLKLDTKQGAAHRLRRLEVSGLVEVLGRASSRHEKTFRITEAGCRAVPGPSASAAGAGPSTYDAAAAFWDDPAGAPVGESWYLG